MKTIVITQSNYIPWKGYFDAIAIADEFVIYDDMQYTRRDWRNRNVIKTAVGNQWLTIPVVVKGKYLQKINETQISDPDWNKKHWNVIREHYSKAPYFNDFKDFFKDLYLDTTETFLTDINFRFLKAICEILEIQTNFRFSSEFDLKEERSERLVAICKELNGTDYYSGPAAKSYMDEQVFIDSNVKVHYFDYNNYPEYKQQHEPFTHYVSVIDLLFNTGKEAKNYLNYNFRTDKI